ncbi:vp80 [Matsumuraeses phaseoli granulovirus]|uniref:Vp80 n=1 Tax=Matsumuraeses phaseoli granulovirus TaxID=2760664 RepID=A0AAE7SYN4_9BBAC|nr:vp80 [Matsumuraeses phaseoli granulovirus]QOD39987.1 vp80 [Matsumuraeses phaseoli granulovirus]
MVNVAIYKKRLLSDNDKQSNKRPRLEMGPVIDQEVKVSAEPEQSPSAEPEQSPSTEPKQSPAEPEQSPSAEPEQSPAEPEQSPSAEPKQSPAAEPEQSPAAEPSAVQTDPNIITILDSEDEDFAPVPPTKKSRLIKDTSFTQTNTIIILDSEDEEETNAVTVSRPNKFSKTAPTHVPMNANLDIPADAPADAPMNANLDIPADEDINADVTINANLDTPADAPTNALDVQTSAYVINSDVLMNHAEPESSESEPEYVHQNSILARRYRQRRDAVPRQARSRSRSPVRRSRSRTPDYSPVRRDADALINANTDDQINAYVNAESDVPISVIARNDVISEIAPNDVLYTEIIDVDAETPVTEISTDVVSTIPAKVRCICCHLVYRTEFDLFFKPQHCSHSLCYNCMFKLYAGPNARDKCYFCDTPFEHLTTMTSHVTVEVKINDFNQGQYNDYINSMTPVPHNSQINNYDESLIVDSYKDKYTMLNNEYNTLQNINMNLRSARYQLLEKIARKNKKIKTFKTKFHQKIVDLKTNVAEVKNNCLMIDESLKKHTDDNYHVQDETRLSETLKKYEETIVNLKQELSETQKTYEKTIVDLKQKLENKYESNLSQTNLNLRETIKNYEGTIDDLREMQTNYEDIINNLERTQKLHEVNFSETQQNYEETIVNLKQELSETQKHKFNETQKHYEETIVNLKQEFSKTLKHYEETIVSLKQDNFGLSEDIKKKFSCFDEDLKKKDKTIADLIKNNESLSNSLQKCNKDEEYTAYTLLNLKKDREQLTLKISDCEKIINDLKKDFNLQIDDRNKIISHLKKDLEQLISKVDCRDKIINDLKKEINDRDKSIDKRDETLTTKDHQIAFRNKQISELKRKFNKKIKELKSSHNDTIAELKSSHDKAIDDLNETNKTLERTSGVMLLRQISDISDELKSSCETVDNYINENNKLKQDYQKMIEKNQLIMKQMNALRKTIRSNDVNNNLIKEYNSMIKKIDTRDKKIKLLQNKLKQKFNCRNISISTLTSQIRLLNNHDIDIDVNLTDSDEDNDDIVCIEPVREIVCVDDENSVRDLSNLDPNNYIKAAVKYEID